MIDLAVLEKAANAPGESAVVSRRFLRQALSELREGRKCLERRGQTFGLSAEQRL